MVIFKLISCGLCFTATFLFCIWIIPIWDNLAKRRVADLTPRLSSLGLADDVTKLLRWWGLLLLVIWTLFGFLLAMVPVAFGLSYLVYIAPPYVLDYFIKKRKTQLRDQMVAATTALANATRAGLTLIKALEAIVSELPKPLSQEFGLLIRKYNAGRPLADAIRDMQNRLDIEAFTLFAGTVLVCMERGGKMSFALERVSENLQELQRLERKLEADTASGRLMATILALFPLAFLAGFSIMDPVSMGFMYTTLLGQLILLGVGVIIYFAVQWCGRILTVEF